MHRSRLRLWLAFIGWLIGAISFGELDHIRRTSRLLPAYVVGAAVSVVVKPRPRKYRFEFVAPRVVRSPLSFELRASMTGLQYVCKAITRCHSNQAR